MSTALDAATPAISVSCAAGAARIASAPSPIARDRGTRPSAACAGATRAPRPGCRRRQRRSARVVRCVVPPGISSPAPWRYNGARHRSARTQERPAAARHCRVALALALIVGLFIVSRRHAR
jgi:hypothetical protein